MPPRHYASMLATGTIAVSFVVAGALVGHAQALRHRVKSEVVVAVPKRPDRPVATLPPASRPALMVSELMKYGTP